MKKIENIVKGEIDLSTIEMFISKEAHDSQKRSQLQENDVLFSIAGTIGDTAIVKKEHLPMNINQAIALIRPKNILNTFFLKYSLLSIISQKTQLSDEKYKTNDSLSLECLSITSELKLFSSIIIIYYLLFLLTFPKIGNVTLTFL